MPVFAVGFGCTGSAMPARGGNGHRLPFANRLRNLSRVTAGKKVGAVGGREKQALAVVKTCLKRRRDARSVLSALNCILSARNNKERSDFGGRLLAEYVACRSGIPVLNAIFLKCTSVCSFVFSPRCSFVSSPRCSFVFSPRCSFVLGLDRVRPQ